MQWMIEDTPGHVINYNRGLPWKAKEAMQKSSPLYAVDKVETPTLIHVDQSIQIAGNVLVPCSSANELHVLTYELRIKHRT